MVKKISILFLFLLINNNLLGQVSNSELYSKRLNSFLSSGDLTSIEKELNNSKIAKTDSSYINKINSEYLELIRNIKFRIQKDKQDKIDLVEQYFKMKNLFSEQKAGTDAHHSYNKFVEMYKQNDLDLALKFYSIAYFQKSRHIDGVQKNFIEKYILLKKLYSSNEYDSTLQIIKELEHISKNHLVFKQWEDSLHLYRNRAESKYEEQVKYAKEFKSDEKYFKKYHLSIVPQLVFSPPIQNIEWKTKNNNQDLILYINKIPASFAGGVCVNFDFALSNKIFIGSQLRYGKFSYDSVVEDGSRNISQVKHSVTYSSINLISKFLFRDKVGARPYIDLGLGYALYKRNSFEVLLTNLVYKEIKMKKIYTPQVVADLGIDYIFNVNSNFVYGFAISSYYNIKNNDLSSRFNFSANVKLGINF